MKKSNKYYIFLENLLKDLRITANGFQEKYDIRSFSTIMNKLKNDPDKKLHPETIGRIEEALKIRINDTNPNHITYTKQTITESDVPFTGVINVYQYPILATVYAGEPEMLNHEVYDESAAFAYQKEKHNCFALRVNGQSMETTLKDGDIVLVDMNLIPLDGDLVAVRLKNGNQYIKRFYDENHAFVRLTSDNHDYGVRLVDKNDIEAIYPVVQITINLRNGERKR